MNDDAEYERLKGLYRDCAFYDAFGSAAWVPPQRPDYQPAANLEQTLREFCLASGRDLHELNGFFHQVGCDMADAVPK